MKTSCGPAWVFRFAYAGKRQARSEQKPFEILPGRRCKRYSRPGNKRPAVSIRRADGRDWLRLAPITYDWLANTCERRYDVDDSNVGAHVSRLPLSWTHRWRRWCDTGTRCLSLPRRRRRRRVVERAPVKTIHFHRYQTFANLLRVLSCTLTHRPSPLPVLDSGNDADGIPKLIFRTVWRVAAFTFWWERGM